MRKLKKALSMTLALALSLTVPAFADSAKSYSVNGYTDPAAENVEFSVAPIGVATIRISSWKTEEYTAYVFDQDCVVTRKDGLPITHFILDDGSDRHYVNIGNENFPYLYVDVAGISGDFDAHWLFQFGPDESEGETDWSPYMMSKKGLDRLPIEDDYYSATVLEYRPLSTEPTTPTEPQQPAVPDAPGTYTVKAGDTLGKIAAAEYGKADAYKAIFERNADRLKNANTIYEGQVIVLPAKK